MIAVDTNVLVYAHRREVAEHAVAAAVVRDLAQGELAWAIPWPCLYEFHGIVTNDRIWKGSASTPAQSWAQLEAWARSPSVKLLAETEGFLARLKRFVDRARVRGAVVHDARVAAICVEHGVEELLTRDRDFALFPELSTRNPFAR